MKTWKQVLKAINDDLYIDKYEPINPKAKSPDAMYPKEFVEFAHEVEHYLKIGLNEINAKPYHYDYTGYRFYLYFKIDNNNYVISLGRYSTYCTIYALPDTISFGQCYFYGYKHRDIDILNVTDPKNLFKNLTLPKHAKYKIGDLVYINKKILKTWYGVYHKNCLRTIYKIIKVSYKSNAVWYSVQDIEKEKPDNYPDSYAETNLTKFEGGV